MVRSDKENIQRILESMAKYNSTPEYGTTRIFFTKPEVANRENVKNEMRAIGLEVEEDSIGNIFAKLKGTKEGLSPIWTGSHIDTVPNAGNFDGMAGVVCGIEALRMIKEAGCSHDRDIYVNVYTSEEPTRYGLSCLGSRALAGELSLEDTKKLADKGQKSLYEKLEELGYHLDEFHKIAKKPGDVFATVELHVEQNNRLEKAGKKVGIVKNICAPSNYKIQVNGGQAHAGGQSMDERHDAFAAACEMCLFLEKLAQECPSEYNTATVGVVSVFPGGINVIPGKVEFSVDIRDCTMNTKAELIKAMFEGFNLIAQKRGVTYSSFEENNDVPLVCNAEILDILRDSCQKLGVEYEELISGPYHDSLFIGKFAPTAMIFVKSKNGVSHSPDEWTDYEDLALGTEVLAKALLSLANMEKSI